MSKQSKRGSFIEVLINIGSGMLIAFTISQTCSVYEAEIQKYIWSGFVWNVSATGNAAMTTLLTLVSVLRSYIWRRIFNRFGGVK